MFLVIGHVLVVSQLVGAKLGNIFSTAFTYCFYIYV